jgi:hypothetical protein
MNHDPEHSPGIAREVFRIDRGGWISGPSASPDNAQRAKGDVAEPVRAEHVMAGDILLLDDGIHAEVDDVRHGLYWFPDGQAHGVAIGWQAGRSSGLLFRKASDVLARQAGGSA